MTLGKKMALAGVAVAALGLVYVKLAGVSYTVSIAQPELQIRIEAAIPKETELTGGTLHVTGVVVGFDDAGNRLRVQLALEFAPSGPLPPSRPPLPGPPRGPGGPPEPPSTSRGSARIPVTVELLGGLAYDTASGEIRIHTAELGKIGGDQLPEAFRAPVRQVASVVLAKALEGRSITTLDAGGTARLVLDRVWVEGDRLWIAMKIGG